MNQENKKKMKKKGFTLVELLGTIAVLAIIALILIPIVTGVIETSRRKAFENSVYHAMDSIKDSYAAEDFKEIPKSGVSAQYGIPELEKNPFIGGIFKPVKGNNLYASMVTDGRYCALGTKEELIIGHVPCESLDETPPELTVLAGLITSNSIQVIAQAKDDETAIIGYEYSIDDGKTWTKREISNSHTFSSLKNGTNYKIKVRVTNENDLKQEKGIQLKTLDIPLPTYTSVPDFTVWSKSKVVTIHYPERQSNFIYEYSLDNGKTWLEVPTGTTKDVTFTKNGTITARIKDGYNVVQSSTLTITTIDDVAPSIPTSVIRYDSSSGEIRGSLSSWTNRTLWWGQFTSTDKETGIDHYEYSDGCTGNKTGNLQSSYTYSSDMNKKYCIRAVDKAGNVSGWSQENLFFIDKTNPTCGTINLSGTTGNNGWYKGTVTVTKSDGSDALSGHASTTVSTGAISGDTKGTSVTLTTKDRAGNTCTTSKTVKIDGTKPTCGTIKLSGTTGNNGWYRSLVTVGKTDGSDATSGHASTTVSTSSVGDTNGTTVTLTTKDNAGNVCTTTSGTIKVDTRAPQNITVYVQSSSSYYNQTNVTVNVPYSSSFCTAGSKYGLSSYKASDGGSSITFYHNYSSSTRCPNGTAFTGCRRGETHTRKAFSPTSVIPDYFAGTAGYHSGYYTGYATGVYTIWAEDAAGNRSNEAKITMNFCTR